MSGGRDSERISFGPFRLSPTARVLEKNGRRVEIGSRALDILIVLVEHAGEVVDQRELLSRVWRGLVVCPSNLRVHMNALRRALNDSVGHVRYVANVTGQGYCFVAPIRREEGAASVPPLSLDARDGRGELPPLLERIVGRDSAVRLVATEVMAERFVTVIGPGGIGKTTVSVAAAHSLLAEFGGTVRFVDLSAVCDPGQVLSTVAAALGLDVQTERALLDGLRAQRLLLVLDNCEHVIAVIASLAERIFSEAPGVHILATSREGLRVEGERTYLLPPLSCPSATSGLNATVALDYPAVQLFMERATTSGYRSSLTDADAQIVASICRKLDGIALAIELAASQVGTHGIVGMWNLLQNRLALHWRGRRTAPPRHQTLRTSIEWGYRLLGDAEQLALRRLSGLTGSFTVEAAAELAPIPALDALVAKSLLSVATSEDGSIRYGLLEMTRAYVLEELRKSTRTIQLVRPRRTNPSAFPSIACIAEQDLAVSRARDQSPSRRHAS